MEFGNLHYLWLLLLLPVLIIFYIFTFRRKQKAMEQFAQLELLEQLAFSVSKGKQKLKAASLIIGVLFITLSLIQPKFGYHWEKVKRKGVDIVILLDTSKSMLAADVLPNRLSAAKREISDLLNIVETKGDRVGLVAFAGTAFIQCPLTLDYGAFRMFLDDVDVDTIPQGGTAIGQAIRKGIQAFEGKLKKYKVMILITDGEDHSGNAVDAAKEAKKNGIVIYTVGVGTRAGNYIWITDKDGNKKRLKDRDGNFVKSKLDETTLAKIALATGGKSTRADSQDWPLEKIYTDAIGKMEKRELGSQRIKRYENRYQWPLSIALLFITLEAIMSERKRV